MWMPKKVRDRLSKLENDADDRLAASQVALHRSKKEAEQSAKTASRSQELEDANNISRIIAYSLGLTQPSHGRVTQ